jgi:hypothetical protein
VSTAGCAWGSAHTCPCLTQQQLLCIRESSTCRAVGADYSWARHTCRSRYLATANGVGLRCCWYQAQQRSSWISACLLLLPIASTYPCSPPGVGVHNSHHFSILNRKIANAAPPPPCSGARCHRARARQVRTRTWAGQGDEKQRPPIGSTKKTAVVRCRCSLPPTAGLNPMPILVGGGPVPGQGKHHASLRIGTCTSAGCTRDRYAIADGIRK